MSVKKYIDAETLKAWLGEASFKSIDDYRIALEIVRRIPPADVIPIVRCRDCKYWKHNEPESLFHGGFCHKKGDYRDADRWCCDAEQK